MATSHSVLKDLRILVIDDMVESRSSLKKMSASLGATQIDTAVDGDQATVLLNNKHYDLVLSDYNLGKGKDGQQVLEEARYSKRLPSSSAFVLVTGENATDMVMGALEYDPDSYITKPITLGILEQRLKRLFDIRRVLMPIYQAIDKDKTDEAIDHAEAILKQNPRFIAPITRLLGTQYMKKKLYNQAIRTYSALLNERSVSWAWLGQGVCLHHLGDSLSALALLKETLRRHPKYVQCYDWMAKIYVSLDDKELAQRLLEKAIAISPRAVLRQRELGALAIANEDWEVASKAYEQAVRLGRHSCYKSHDAYLKFAQAAQPLLEEDHITHKRTGDKVQRALNELETDSKNKPTICFVALLSHARIARAQQQQDKASRLLSDAEHLYQQKEKPPTSDTLALSQAFIDNGEHVKAKNLLKSVDLTLLTPPDRQAVLAQLHELDQTVIRQHSDAINALGVSLYEQGKLEEARKAFDEAIEYDEAGVSVLLNAIQVRISMINDAGCTLALKKELIMQCRPLFQRIGPIGQSDERHQRFHRLKKRFTSLLQDSTA